MSRVMSPGLCLLLGWRCGSAIGRPRFWGFVCWEARVPSSPPVALGLWGCGALFSFWFPVLWGRCASGLPYMEHTLAALFGQSLTLFIEGSPSAGAVGPPPTLAGQVWSLFLFSPAAPGGCSPSVFLLRLSVPVASCRTLSCCSFLPRFLPLALVQAGVWGLGSCLGPPFFFFFGGGGALSLSLVLVGFFFSNPFIVQAPWFSRPFCWGFPSSRFQCLLIARGG